MIPGATQAAGPIIGALAQLPQSLAVGMNFATAVGGLGLVVLGVAIGLYFAQRRREFEFASLRAMGTEPKQVSRVLLLEQGLMITFAIASVATRFFLTRVRPVLAVLFGMGIALLAGGLYLTLIKLEWVPLAAPRTAWVAASMFAVLMALSLRGRMRILHSGK